MKARDTMQIDTTKPVLVTGATGYVAGWIVKDLLAAGVTVHAAVRDPENATKVGHLTAMAEISPGNLHLFKTDLLQMGSYAAAIKGCGTVFHTASPFTLNVRDPQTDLIDPAVNGTRNVLDQATQTDTVTRVVLTSSCAAIYTDAADCANAPNATLTEDIWNTTATIDHQPYSLSKTLAEHAAWDIAGAQSGWDLVVINPSLVVGPSVNANPTSESFGIVGRLGDGSLKSGAPRFSFGLVDVRDLATAHIAAAYTADAKGRHIISAHNTDMLEMAGALQDEFGADFPLPKRVMPKWLFWTLAPLVGLTRKYVARNVNYTWKADNSKGRKAFGLTYRPLKTSMQDMFRQLVESGAFK